MLRNLLWTTVVVASSTGSQSSTEITCSVDNDCETNYHCYRPGSRHSQCIHKSGLGAPPPDDTDTEITCSVDNDCETNYHCYRPGGTHSQCIHNSGLGAAAGDYKFEYNNGASYAYKELHTDKGWKLLDDNAIENKTTADGFSYEYAYYFNVGSDLDRSQWKDLEKVCGDTTKYPGVGSGSEVTAPCYQMWSDHSRCEKIGGPVSDATTKLYIADALDRPDEKPELLDPSKGFAIVYSNGDACGAGNRSLTLFIRCEDDDTPVPEHEPVQEDVVHACHYSISIPSIHGCPTQCHSDGANGTRMCGGHGNCVYDWDKEAAGCACDEGYYGGSCLGSCPAGCGGHGHCSWDEDKQAAHCFCNPGYEGGACDQAASPSETESSSGGGGGCAFAWVLVVLLVISFVVFYAYHRSEMQLTFLPGCCGGGKKESRTYDNFVDDDGYSPPTVHA